MSQNKPVHVPVLLKEVVNYLALLPGRSVVDGTLGLGGHALSCLKEIGVKGKYYGFDLDENNLKIAKKRLQLFSSECQFFQDSFVHCHDRLQELGITAVDAILLDLGLSSPHVDDASRGFSFQKKAPLDMRFDRSKGLTAAHVLNNYTEYDLKTIFYRYGEEKYAPKLARMIVARRREKALGITEDLMNLIQEIMRSPKDQNRMASRVFQALRIEVNDELNVLREAIPSLLSLLKSGGRMVVISYHSLEDRIVKQGFKQAALNDCDYQILTKKPIVPSEAELQKNPRSRSAKLRAIFKS
ncbi:MAG: 16S rRNA methyltransferase [Candidatus Peregrinibacteria bacterium GW2011_GWF2_39_17]|nr:MAG: 16S rRNA methyltransferase [Candidatus Peregrinibacteria bacterium GW2011_GWF2_39_17]